MANEHIGARVGVSAETVRAGRAAFAQQGVAGLGVIAKGRGRKAYLAAGRTDQSAGRPTLETACGRPYGTAHGGAAHGLVPGSSEGSGRRDIRAAAVHDRRSSNAAMLRGGLRLPKGHSAAAPAVAPVLVARRRAAVRPGLRLG